MPDAIHLSGYRFQARAGLAEEERAQPQPFELELWVELDLSVAGRSGNLEDTLDYGALARWLRGQCQGAEFRLLEELAERLASGILLQFPLAGAVRLSLRKLKPAHMEDFALAAVELERRRRRV